MRIRTLPGAGHSRIRQGPADAEAMNRVAGVGEVVSGFSLSTEASLPALIAPECTEDVAFAERRPAGITEVELAVGTLCHSIKPESRSSPDVRMIWSHYKKLLMLASLRS